MKCNEIKNNIREASNLKSMHADKEIRTHLENCVSCNNYFLYEKKLRQGFSEIAEQHPPTELESRFMNALHQEKETEQHGRWFSSLSDLFATFHYKTALVSCLIGFFAAILLQQTGHFRDDYTHKPDPLPAVSKASSPGKARSSKIKLSESDNSMIALKKKPQTIKRTDELQKQGIENVVLKESEPMIESTENNYSENISTRMMAKKETSAKKSRAAPVTAMFRSSAPSASAPEVDSFAPEGRQQDSSDKVVPDQRIAELEKIIDNYALELEAGPLNVKTLAVKGLIPSEKLDYFAPPPGMTWFIQIKDDRRKVILKKEK